MGSSDAGPLRFMEKRIKADLALAFCSLIWGVTFVVVKNALDHASVFVFLAVRFTLAAGLMAMFRPKVLALLGIFWGRRLTKWMYAGSLAALAALAGLYFLTVPAEGMRYLNPGDVLT